MRKIISITILILFICTLTVGCTNDKPTEETADTPESASTSEATQAPEPTALSGAAAQQALAAYDIIVPTLSIEYKDEFYTALRGATSWTAYLGDFSKKVSGSTIPPEMLVEDQKEPIVVSEDGYLNLVFSKKPLRYEVMIWDSENYADSETLEISDNKVPVSADSPYTIYQVVAEFYSLEDNLYEEGKVYYCFTINEKLD